MAPSAPSTSAELREKLAVCGVKGGLAGLGADGEKEAVSRIAIDHVLSLVCRESNATLSLEEFLGDRDPESRAFPCAVCDYVLRDSTGRVAAIVEAKKIWTSSWRGPVPGGSPRLSIVQRELSNH